MQRQLQSYESWLQEYDQELTKELPKLATAVVDELIPKISGHIDNILIIGKTAGASSNNKWNEADLMIIKPSSDQPVSIKLCKENSYINTKSGGAKSFLSKYFQAFVDCSVLQENLNLIIDQSFYNMGQLLHDHVNLEFHGQFDNSWTEHGHTEFPGKLNPTLKKIVRNYYHEVITGIYNSLLSLNKQDPTKFAQALHPIVGFGNEDILQAICFHGTANSGIHKRKYQLKRVAICDIYDVVEQLAALTVTPQKSDLSSFEIALRTWRLQIRVKPMNKFTLPGLKVNCSVKK
ncbi:MAG: hypothetical protein ISR65_10035 [Bacteriovoracaceae bacterium]|nr:hypothetical protein [Bacteriovoracaceae bacterium]